jgi:acetyl esterase/lipase
MRNCILLLLILLLVQLSFGQTAASLYKAGDSLYKAKEYKNAAISYAEGIRMEGKAADIDRYWKVASRWALAEEADSVFHFLNMLTKSAVISQGDASGMEADKDFKSVHTDKRWRPVMDKIMAKGMDNYKVDELIYGRKDGVALTMLHIKPRTKSNGKSIIWVIAGSWFSSYQQAQRTIRPSSMFLDKGFTVFLVILGSQPRYAIPDEIEDAKRAVRYIRYNAKQWQIDANKIGITGGSAGGHLSLAVAMADEKTDSLATDPVNRVSSRVQAAAVLYPPTDCLNWGGQGLSFINNKNLQLANSIYGALDFTKWNELNATYDHITDTATRNKIAKEMSPIYYVSADDPPIFIIHGDADKTVPLQQSETFIARLKEAGVQNKFIIKKGGIHNPSTMMPEFLDFADWFAKNLE